MTEPVLIRTDDPLTGEPKWGVGVLLPQEDVERGWPAFAILDRALRRSGPWPWGELGRWELKVADYDRPRDAWVIRFRAWPGE